MAKAMLCAVVSGTAKVLYSEGSFHKGIVKLGKAGALLSVVRQRHSCVSKC